MLVEIFFQTSPSAAKCHCSRELKNTAVGSRLQTRAVALLYAAAPWGHLFDVTTLLWIAEGFGNMKQAYVFRIQLCFSAPYIHKYKVLKAKTYFCTSKMSNTGTISTSWN